MKKSKRILASVMSALLILPSAVLPFSATAADAYPNADPSEPYYVVGRFQAKGTETTTTVDVQENTGDDAATYPNKMTTGAVTIKAETSISLTGFDTKNLAFMVDVTYTRQDGKTGENALQWSGNQVLNVRSGSQNVLQLAGQPYMTALTNNYSNRAGETITYLIPWTYVYNGTAINKNPAETVDDFYWFMYNDSWKVDIDGNGKFDDAYGVDVTFADARIVDTSRLGDGSINPVVAVYNGGEEVAVDYTGTRTWNEKDGVWSNANTVNQFGYAPASNNTPAPADYTVKLDNLENLQAEFDVMVENPDNHPKFDASKFNGIIRMVVAGKQVDYTWGWDNFVKETDKWVHVTVPLANIYSGNNALTEDGLLGILMLFAYDNHDMRDSNDDTDSTSIQQRFAHAIVHTKNVRVVDTSLAEETPKADLTALNEVIAEAETLIEADYTAESWADVQSALTAAKALTEDSLQEDVNAAETALREAIDALVAVDPVPANYVPIGTDEIATTETHNHVLTVKPETALDLAEYADRDLSVTFKLKVNKTETFPTEPVIQEAEWLKHVCNGTTRIGNTEVVKSAALAAGYYSAVNETGVWKDVTIPLPKTITSINEVVVQFYNDLHKSFDPDFVGEYKDGITLSLKDMYLIIGDVSPVARWSALEKTWNQSVAQNTQMYANWANADGLTGNVYDGTEKTTPGIDMSGDAENGANPNYVFKATATFEPVGDTEAENLLGMLKEIIFRPRSTKTDTSNGEPNWGNISGTALTEGSEYAKVTDQTIEISYPLSLISTGNLDWSDVKQLVFIAVLKDEYKPSEGNAPDYMTMTLSNVKVVEKEPDPVDRTALNKAIADAEAKLADGKTYTEATLAVLNEKLEAAKAVADDADQTTVNAAAEALNDAIAELVEKEPDPVDRTALNKAIADAEAKLADGKTYTEATLAVLNEKLEAAKAVDDDADQTTVNAAAEALNDAIAGLVEETTPVDPIQRIPLPLGPNGETEMTSEEQHSLSVAYTPVVATEVEGDGEADTPVLDPIDLKPYVGSELSITFKFRVNKTDNFPEALADTLESEWIKYIRNGSLLLFGATDTDADKWASGEGGNPYKLTCGQADGLLQDASTTDFVEVTIPVPQAIIDAGQLSRYSVLIYNDLHALLGGDATEQVEGSQGVTITVKDMYLVVDNTNKADKTALDTLLKGMKTDEQLAIYTAASVAAYKALFATAQEVYDDPDATAAQVAAQVRILQKADSVLAEDIAAGGKVALTEEDEVLQSAVQHYMSVNKTFDPAFDFGKYGPRDSVKITLKMTVYKDDATFPESLKDATPEEWLTHIKDGRLILWGADTTDASKVNLGELDAANILACGSGKLEGITLSLPIEVTFDVPASIVESGKISKLEFFMYNNLHNLTTVEDDQNNGVYITVEDIALVLGEPVAVNKDALNAAIDAAEELNEEDYTETSWADFAAALEAAKDMALNGTATQAAIDAATKALTDAKNALIPVGGFAYGDLNGVGGVTAEDALLALQIATGKVTPTQAQIQAGNVDGQGDVTANDALLILQHATKKIASFPVENTAE